MAKKKESILDKMLGNIRGRDGKNLGDALDEAVSGLSEQDRHTVKSYLNAEADKEIAKAPKIAIIGNTGVGKTSTINALFGTKLPVSHVEACTQQEEEVSFDGKLLDGAAGNIIIYDMPGLGEDIEADERHKRTYTRVIAECDVAVWLLTATGRAMSFDQMMIRDVVAPANINLASRLVIGINQIDTIQPGHWIDEGNLPSRTQRQSIERRIKDIREKFIKVVPGLMPDRIVPYSAIKRYHLVQLFEVMLHACAHDRAWVLHSRKSIADYSQLINPRILDLVRSRQKGK